MENIKVLYEDNDIIVCHKPAMFPVQTKNLLKMDMERMLLNMQSKQGKNPQIYVIHRLDQPVEGIIVFAKNKNSAAKLSSQFKQKLLSKEYLAVVANGFSNENVHLEDYLLKNQKQNYSSVVSKETPGSKLAVLDLTVIAGKENTQLVRINLKTGRHHQIRVQLSNAGCPILGDAKYNDSYIERKGFHKTALCACKLTFVHPQTAEKMTFQVNPINREFEIYSEEIKQLYL